MEKFFLLIMLALLTTISAYAGPEGEVSDSRDDQNEFWPPDMIPHPHPPDTGPSGPGEPEIV